LDCETRHGELRVVIGAKKFLGFT